MNASEKAVNESMRKMSSRLERMWKSDKVKAKTKHKAQWKMKEVGYGD